MKTKHSEHSSYREKLIEHLFIGELLKISWKYDDCLLEVAKPEVDNAGYDVVLEANRVMRHVQLKSSYSGARVSKQNVHVKLSEKPSGCIIWVYFNEETLELGPFYFFGAAPGKPLPSLETAKVAKHTKGNSEGYKAERPNIRVLNKGDFTCFNSAFDVYQALFYSSGIKDAG
ncbi:hypothetical protein G8768_11915 [Pseudoteredinibacter isoporae]|nr:hypothetical protein [Pseudoteredinibacter isoporae]NHO87660.1 hypothetical protein [Pseudoteredinibacter isoporae]NIB24009.1 hypothetical protein [Pseudoteredinibacter isoporae]